MSAPAKRRQQKQIVLEVIERIQLTPHLVRIVAGGPGIADVADNGSTDAYTKMAFLQPGSTLTAPYDWETLRETMSPEELPAIRTYTIRKFNLGEGTVWIDFVVHGTEGIAGPWADTAQPGDAVVLLGIGGGYAPDPAADWHLIAGDESAIPAISSAVEAMKPDAVGEVLIEVSGEEDHLSFDAPEGVRVTWLHRGSAEAGTTSLLIDAVKQVEWRDGRVQVFIHGERGAMKQVRPYLTDERGLDRSQLSLSAYWAYGRKEDTFQAEKRESIGQI